MTFKDLKRIIAEKKKEAEQESKFYDPKHYWKGKKIVSLDQWYQIKEGYGLKAALQFFPNGYRYGFACTFDDIDDTVLKEEADQWDSDYLKLMEYSKNTEYGKTKCFRCLLSPDREDAAIFIGMNKAMSRSLDTTDVTSISIGLHVLMIKRVTTPQRMIIPRNLMLFLCFICQNSLSQ